MYKLLIADDEMIERDAIRYIINQHFQGVFEIDEACNGKEAIEKAVAFKPDVVFFDIRMPGLSGLDAAARVREFIPECRIILISAYHYFNYAKDALALGADDYITKPAPEEKIVSTLEKAVAFINKNRIKKKKEEETDNKLKQITRYLEEELLLLMTSGELDERSIKNYFDILDIDCRLYICAVISISDEGYCLEAQNKVQESAVKRKVIEKIKLKLKSMGYNCFAGTVGQEVYVLLLVNNDFDEYQSRLFNTKLFKEVKDDLYNDMKVNISAGIGNTCHALSQIYSSFLQAKISLKYDMTPGAVNSYGDIAKDGTKAEYPVNKEKLLYESMIQGDEKNSGLLLDELIDWMAMNISSIDILKQKVFELLLVLMRETSMNINLKEMDVNTEELRKTISSLDNSREIRAFAKKYIVAKTQEIKNIKMNRANSLLKLVTDFLENNYNKEILLEEVAEMVKISPFYLSKLFKQEAGENFIDYLTNIRIKKAKELLADPLNNIKDICYQVGYRDPNYFTRVFKKICGVTPTEYKIKNML